MKNCKKSLLASIIAFAFAISDASTQFNSAASLGTLAGRFIKNIKVHPKEKILLQTDRSFYLAGETVWFSVGLVMMTGLTEYLIEQISLCGPHSGVTSLDDYIDQRTVKERK